MVKFIGNWMFASRVWNYAEPTPVAINLREIESIGQTDVPELNKDCVIVQLKHSEDLIQIEGNIIEVLAEFQKHLQTIY